MTDRDLLKQALEALEDACGGRCNAENNPCWQREIADALRERLAQPPEDRARAFLRRLLDPEDLGHAVSHEVRQKVRELL